MGFAVLSIDPTVPTIRRFAHHILAGFIADDAGH